MALKTLRALWHSLTSQITESSDKNGFGLINSNIVYAYQWCNSSLDQLEMFHHRVENVHHYSNKYAKHLCKQALCKHAWNDPNIVSQSKLLMGRWLYVPIWVRWYNWRLWSTLIKTSSNYVIESPRTLSPGGGKLHVLYCRRRYSLISKNHLILWWTWTPALSKAC